MSTIMNLKTWTMIVMVLISVSCDNDEDDDAVVERKLPEMMKFTGEADGTEGDLTIHCACDLNLELPEFETTGQTQAFTGTLGGEIGRAVTQSSGDGFAFEPFLFGDITLTVMPNDSVYLSWPGNLDTGIPFYDEIALFKGVFNPDEKTVTGTWVCSPLNLNEGGYVDMEGHAEGTWHLEEFN